MPKALDLTSLVDSSLSPQIIHIPRCTLPHLHSTPKSNSQILHCDQPPHTHTQASQPHPHLLQPYIQHAPHYQTLHSAFQLSLKSHLPPCQSFLTIPSKYTHSASHLTLNSTTFLNRTHKPYTTVTLPTQLDKHHNRIPHSYNSTLHISLIIKLYSPLFNFPSKPGRPGFSPAPIPARTAIS